MDKPKEDPEDKKQRDRERKRSIFERRRATEEQADGLTSDFQSIYGMSGMNMFSPAPKPTPQRSTSTERRTGDDR